MEIDPNKALVIGSAPFMKYPNDHTDLSYKTWIEMVRYQVSFVPRR